MHRVLRLAMTCLLLVAVPLQGYAAAGMLFCGGADGAASPVTVQDAHAHHAADGDDGHPHHAVVENDGTDGALDLHDVMHGCSACSSCCSAAALPSPPIASGAEPPRALPVMESDSADTGRRAARLERPPRPDLA